ncbi:MAG TPA: hypothetical protein VGP44_06710 [Gemmatimonadales bacterium]|nr:hypothetical protein [Gemmatimonadales bacterium]
MRLLVMGALALAGCGPGPASAPVRLVESRRAGRAILAVVPLGQVRINARVPPAIELRGGSVLRLPRGRISGDSSYFLDPPWQVRPAMPVIRGNLRVSYCRADEALCRSVVLPVRLP